MNNIKGFYLAATITLLVLFGLVGCSSEPVLSEKQIKNIDTICVSKGIWNVPFQDGGKNHSINKISVIEKDGECLLIVGWVFSTGDYGSVKTYGGETRTYKVTESGNEREKVDSGTMLFSRGIDVNFENITDGKIRKYLEMAYLNYLRQ